MDDALHRSRHLLPYAFLSLLTAALAAPGAHAAPDPQTGFPVAIEGPGIPSNPAALGDVDGDQVLDVVIGDNAGKVHAYDGLGNELWVYDTGNMAIAGKPAIGDVDGDGSAEVVVGAGSTATPNSHGGLYVIDHQGGLQCEFMVLDDGDPDSWREGVFSSPALADLEPGDGGRLEIAFGAWDRFIRVIRHDCSPVWQNSVFDTVWSSPAIADLDDDGDLDVVIGQDTGADVGFEDGGLLRAFDGLTGAELAGFPIQINEVVWSSAALGDVDGDGRLEIFAGTGYCWGLLGCAPGGNVHPGVGEYLNGWNHDGSTLAGWPVATPGAYAFASPALADLDQDGTLEIVLNSIDKSGQNGPLGVVRVLEANGSVRPGWPVQPVTPSGPGMTVTFSTTLSPVVADVTGDAGLEVILPSNWELVIWDKDGNQLTRDSFPPAPGALELVTGGPINGPAVGDIDGDGDLEIVASSADGSLYAWDLDGGAAAAEDAPWPAFRRGSDNNGTVPVPGDQIFADGFESGDTSSWSSTLGGEAF